MAALDRVLDELGAEETRPSCDDTLRIRIGLTPDWLIVMAVALCVGVFAGAIIAARLLLI